MEFKFRRKPTLRVALGNQKSIWRKSVGVKEASRKRDAQRASRHGAPESRGGTGNSWPGGEDHREVRKNWILKVKPKNAFVIWER